MDETLPDRLSIDPRSPYYNEALIARGVGIRFNGNEKTNIEEGRLSRLGTSLSRFAQR